MASTIDPLQPRKKPVQERSRATVDAIVEGAVQVLDRHGYRGATIRRITERAGVSIGTYYQYFPNKDALLMTVMQRHFEEGLSMIGPRLAAIAVERPPLDEALHELVAGMLGMHANRPRLHRVLFEEAPLPPSVRAQIMEMEARIIQVVEGLLANYPEVVVPDLSLAAAACVQIVELLTHTWALRHGAGHPIELLEDELVILLHRYLVRDS